jgi:hypothetical protein
MLMGILVTTSPRNVMRDVPYKDKTRRRPTTLFPPAEATKPIFSFSVFPSFHVTAKKSLSKIQENVSFFGIREVKVCKACYFDGKLRGKIPTWVLSVCDEAAEKVVQS